MVDNYLGQERICTSFALFVNLFVFDKASEGDTYVQLTNHLVTRVMTKPTKILLSNQRKWLYQSNGQVCMTET